MCKLIRYDTILNTLVICFLAMTVISVKTVVIGSDTAVTRFNSQQILRDGDIVAAFAGLNAGFKLNSANTQVLMRTTFPVSGDLECNFGTLSLGRDLILQDVSDIKSLGTIFGNNHVFDLAPTTSCIPSGRSTSCVVQFLTSSLQVDQIQSVDWSFDDTIVAVGLNAAGAAHDLVYTYLFDGTTLTFADSDQPGGFRDARCVRWHPSLLLLAVGKQNSGTADLYTYSVSSVGILTQVDSDNVGTINAVSWHPSGEYLGTGGGQNAAEIRLYRVDSSGNLDIANRVDVNITPNIDVQRESLDWDITGSYLGAGFNNSGAAANFRIFEFNTEPSLSLVENATVVITGFDVESVSWHPTFSSIVAIATDNPTTNNVRIYRHDGSLGLLTELSTTNFPEPVRSVHWSPDGHCLAVGTDNGTGSELSIYNYDSDTNALTESIGFENSSAIWTVRWSRSGENLAAGGNDDTLYIYEEPPLDECITFSDLNISLRCDVDFKDCCIIFSGDNVIRGRGKYLSLDTTCTWVIDSESSLLLKDITVKGLQNPILQFMDNSSTLSLQDVTWVLDDDVTVTLGHFDVLKDFTIQGDGKKLIYQSEVASTIQPCGKMTLDYGVTFSYDPTTDSRDLLVLTDDTAELVLQGATLHSTETGLRLTTGILTVHEGSRLVSEGAVPSEAISFGDGLDAEKNLLLNILPAVQLEISQGFLAYNDI